MKKYVFLFLCLPIIHVFAQELFVIDTRSISVQEFEKKYEANLQTEGLEATLHRMVDAELLYQAALDTKINKRKGVSRVLGDAKAKMVREHILALPEVENYLNTLYLRSIQDAEVQTIFFTFKSKAEFTRQLKKAKEIKAKWDNGTFDLPNFIATNTNPDIKGNLTYFVRGMQEDFAMENLAFSTPKNTVSEPTVVKNTIVLLKKIDIKPYDGDYRIRAISFENDKQSLAKSVFDSLQGGMEFTSALNRYSTLNVEKNSGGYMPFRGANIPTEIWEKVKKLKVKGYAKPTLLNDRWYIFQLYSKTRCTTKDLGCKENFKKDFLKTPLALTIDNVLYESRSRNQVPVRVDSFRLKRTINGILKGESITDSAALATIGESVYPGHALSRFAVRQKINELPTAQAKSLLNESFDLQVRKLVFDEYTNNLELYDTDFAAKWEVVNRSTSISSYMKEVSKVSFKEDSAALRDYYEKNKTLFWDEERMEGVFFICYTADAAEDVAMRLKKKENPEEIVRAFKDQKTENGNPIVVLFSGEFKEDDSRFYGNVPYKKGVYRFSKNNKNYVIKVRELIPPSPVKFEWVSSKVMDYYKDYLLDHNLENLRETIPHGFKKYELRALKEKYANNP